MRVCDAFAEDLSHRTQSRKDDSCYHRMRMPLRMTRCTNYCTNASLCAAVIAPSSLNLIICLCSFGCADHMHDATPKPHTCLVPQYRKESQHTHDLTRTKSRESRGKSQHTHDSKRKRSEKEYMTRHLADFRYLPSKAASVSEDRFLPFLVLFRCRRSRYLLLSSGELCSTVQIRFKQCNSVRP